MTCNSCAAEALGIATDAQFLLDYPGCTEGQKIYCVNGELQAAPRGCTKLFGEARHDFFTGTAYQWPVGGTGPVPIRNFVGVQQDLSFVNDTCYDMNIQLNLSASLLFSMTGDPSRGAFGWSFIATVNGVDNYAAAGGAQGLYGNNFDPWEAINSEYSAPAVAPNDILPPGGAMTVSLQFATNTVFVTNPFDEVLSFNSAVRVVGTTVCP